MKKKKTNPRKDYSISTPRFFAFSMLDVADMLRKQSCQYSRKGNLSHSSAAASIILSYTAIESYVNEEIQEQFEKMAPEERENFECKEFKGEEKILRLSLREKIVDVTSKLTGKKFPTSTNEAGWNYFVEMDEIRHKLIHYRLRRLSEEEFKQGIPGFSSESRKDWQENFLDSITCEKSEKAIKATLRMIAELNRIYHGQGLNSTYGFMYRDVLSNEDMAFMTKKP